MLNRNTDKFIDVTVPIDPETKTFAQEGDCAIAGVDGTAAELNVKFLSRRGRNRKSSSDRNLCGNSGNSGFWTD